MYIDQGCFKALTLRRSAGLLPANIVAVEGVFHESECVSVRVVLSKSSLLQDAVEVGHCRVNYSSVEINLIKGHQSKEIANILGFPDSEYVAHTDGLAFPSSLPPMTDDHPANELII